MIYSEKLTSNKTEALFLALALLFFLLCAWRASAAGWDGLAAALLCLFILFVFYSLNYRTLVIRINQAALMLTFGIFTWSVPLANIAACALDELPPFMRYGGAGIHFMLIRKRYRASFNFLDYPRVVIALKHPVGPVKDISFTTRRPDEILRRVHSPGAG